MIAIAEALLAEENKSLLLNTVRALLSDKSWRVRYMVAEKFVQVRMSNSRSENVCNIDDIL
jgi:serine/threonine-protein phosphatase 2A regulatory subunit A